MTQNTEEERDKVNRRPISFTCTLLKTHKVKDRENVTLISMTQNTEREREGKCDSVIYDSKHWKRKIEKVWLWYLWLKTQKEKDR